MTEEAKKLGMDKNGHKDRPAVPGALYTENRHRGAIDAPRSVFYSRDSRMCLQRGAANLIFWGQK